MLKKRVCQGFLTNKSFLSKLNKKAKKNKVALKMVREFVQYSPFIYFPKCVIIELIIKNALCFG